MKTDSDLDFLFNNMGKIMGILFLIIALGWAALFYLASLAVDEVEEKGLKNIVNEVWEGPNPTPKG